MFLEILTIVLPVFIIVGFGYFATKLNALPDSFPEALMKFTQTYAIPCLLFLSVWRLDLAAAFQPRILLSFYTGSTLCFILGTLGARLIFGRRPGEAVALGFCSLFANSVLLGMPLVERAYGTEALGPIVAVVSIHAPFCYLLGITTMEFARADGRTLPATLRVVAGSMFSSGLMIGILLGFAANLVGLVLPGTVVSALEMMARAALPAALFGLGGILVRYGFFANPGETAMIATIRLVIHPAIALFVTTQVMALPPEVTRVIVLAAAMPPGVNAYVFANMYDRAKNSASAAILVSTVLAVGTATLWLSILHALGI